MNPLACSGSCVVSLLSRGPFWTPFCFRCCLNDLSFNQYKPLDKALFVRFSSHEKRLTSRGSSNSSITQPTSHSLHTFHHSRDTGLRRPGQKTSERRARPSSSLSHSPTANRHSSFGSTQPADSRSFHLAFRHTGTPLRLARHVGIKNLRNATCPKGNQPHSFLQLHPFHSHSFISNDAQLAASHISTQTS